MLAGWGAFNLVEGVIDHHLLHLHHVVEQHGVSLYDGLFLLSGILFLGAGLGLVRSARGGHGDEVARHAAGRIPTTR
jgi:uncharacterized membrane protein